VGVLTEGAAIPVSFLWIPVIPAGICGAVKSTGNSPYNIYYFV